MIRTSIRDVKDFSRSVQLRLVAVRWFKIQSNYLRSHPRWILHSVEDTSDIRGWWITISNDASERKPSEALFREEVKIPFDGFCQVKSSLPQIKSGLNWGILMQHWARIAINRSYSVICLRLAGKCPASPALWGGGLHFHDIWRRDPFPLNHYANKIDLTPKR